ncbi:hypothetical protein QQS21_011966 [Conoideocrella luteorostrata]|uniref:Uncharacterized protein n=1 Tax=Conoideocrella luteorostrata TaxID=1105319 RepID=A0AAJ0CCB9_9HYPO|nr:hypothetical protein QQS21_011966 [Conoideocrella luteorostrata]
MVVKFTMELAQETDPEYTITLKKTALICESHLRKLLEDEEARPRIVVAREGHWASRQFAEFNLWCTKVGVQSEGLQSIDVRLKDVPEICDLLGQLLGSLQRDLNELQQPTYSGPRENYFKSQFDSDGSDALSFDSLSSPECSDTESDLDNASLMRKKQRLLLQEHVEDTIERLHGHALRIEHAGANHRRKRIEIYRQKDEHKWAYNGFKELALRRAQVQFPLASNAFRERLAESFARRRTRLDYLKKHQKKRAFGMVKQDHDEHPASIPVLESGEGQISSAVNQKILAKSNVPARSRPHDYHTVYSATVKTKLEIGPQQKQNQRAESVATVALQHPGFPPPPRCPGASFQCPYCQLEFRAREAEKNRWRLVIALVL